MFNVLALSALKGVLILVVEVCFGAPAGCEVIVGVVGSLGATCGVGAVTCTGSGVGATVGSVVGAGTLTGAGK